MLDDDILDLWDTEDKRILGNTSKPSHVHNDLPILNESERELYAQNERRGRDRERELNASQKSPRRTPDPPIPREIRDDEHIDVKPLNPGMRRSGGVQRVSNPNLEDFGKDGARVSRPPPLEYEKNEVKIGTVQYDPDNDPLMKFDSNYKAKKSVESEIKKDIKSARGNAKKDKKDKCKGSCELEGKPSVWDDL